MKKIFNTRQEYLQDTINYYWGRPERKCVNTDDSHLNGSCSYTPIGESEGCAIGRVVSLELAMELAMMNGSVEAESVFNELPEWMQKLGQSFLVAVQSLHDNDYFVKNDTADVIKHVEEICCEMDNKSSGIKWSEITFPEI